MKYLSTLGRVAAAAALVAGVIATPSAALADSSLRFHANSGDNCRYGQTDGELTWRTSTTVSSVEVKGVLIDRPLPTDPGTVCRDDRRSSTATFTAYSGTRVIDAERQQVDNGRAEIRLVLSDPTVNVRIDRVVVQVCRTSASNTVPSYCGAPVSYSPTSTTP